MGRLALWVACAVGTGGALFAPPGYAAPISPSVAAAANPVSAVPVSATEGEQFSGEVGTFASCTPSRSSATVDWGDGHSGAATLVPPPPGAASCQITATHTYAEEGNYTTTVSVTVGTQLSGSATSTATVADASLILTGRALSGTTGAPTSGIVAVLRDAGGLGPASQYGVTINWGDGHASPGTLGAGGAVTGSHTYASPGVYSALVSVADDGGQAANVKATVSIAGPSPCAAKPPAPAPPFTPTAATPDARWVQAVYHDLLGRSADTSALAALSKELSDGVSREVVVSFLEGDPDRPLIVGSIYNSYLHRPPDALELSSGSQFLASGGSDEQLAAMVIGSPEYVSSRGGGTTAGFLGSLYCDLLRRSIDPRALNQWQQALAGGATRQQVAQAVLSSTEYRNELIESIYLRFLRRSPTTSERASLVGALAAGATDEQGIASLLSSQEYFHQFTPGGGTIVNPTISGRGVIHLVLQHPATVLLRVLALLPAVQRAAAPPKLSPFRTRLLGTVNLGRHRRGHVTVHWNRRIGRRRLHRGRYALVLEARSGKRLRDVSNALVVKLR